MPLMVDANQQWDRPTAQRMCRVFEDFKLVWIEEPLDAYDHEGHAALAAAFDTPIATGEMLTSAAEHADLIRHRAADYLMPDAPRVGGITPFLKIAAQAESAGLMLAPHFAMELHVHLAAAYPSEPWVEHFDWLEPLFNERLEIRDGRMLVPTRPGLGLSLSEQARAWTVATAEVRQAAVGDNDVRHPADHPHARARQRRHRRQRRRPGRRQRAAVGPGAARPRAAGPQGGAGGHRRRRAGAALWHPHRPCVEGHRRRQLGARAAAEDAGRARPGRPADRHGQAAAIAAAGGPHLRGLPQCRRLGGHAQHPGHHADGAVRGRRHRLRRAAHQGRAAAALSQRRRRGGAGARLRLRRGHRRARCGGADPHAAQHQPEPQLRRRSDGRQPGLREAAARAAAAAGQLLDRRRAPARRGARRGVPAGRRPCRLHVDGRIDHAAG